MAQIIDLREARATGYDALSDLNKSKAEGFIAAVIQSCDFKTMYKALNRQGRALVDEYIGDLLQEQRREGRRTRVNG